MNFNRGEKVVPNWDTIESQEFSFRKMIKSASWPSKITGVIKLSNGSKVCILDNNRCLNTCWLTKDKLNDKEIEALALELSRLLK